MPKPRKQLISLDTTPYYHCVSRCVRRAFLCGVDSVTETSYEHRRQWLEERIHELAAIFAIDVGAYAIMSNHSHLVLHINSVKIRSWTDQEVCERWHKLYKGTLLTQKYAKQEPLNDIEKQTVKNTLAQWRSRLGDISWFMRCLNEPIARRANAEDKCTGKFWEARFKSQALLDEKALAACMAYVDLNPIRAKIASTLESSDHTSIKTRIKDLAADEEANADENADENANKEQEQKQVHSLMAFVGNSSASMPMGLPFELKDYLALLEWTAGMLCKDQDTATPKHLPPILHRLAIAPDKWLKLTQKFETLLKGLAGETQELRRAAQQIGYKRTPGLSACQAAF